MNLSQNNKNHEINFMVKEKLHLCWVINGLRDTKKKIKCNKLVNYSKDNYTKRIKYLRKQLILYYLKNIFFLPIWIINIFKRNFLQDEPSVLSNIKVIFTKKEFRPLRAAIIFWTIFFIFLISGVVYIVKNSNITNAASFTWVQSDWSGNPDGGSVADHTNNRTGWTQYESVSNIYVSSTGQLSLTTSTYSLTDGPSFSTTGDDTGGDFDSGVNANTAVSSSSVRLAVSATSSVNIWNSTDLPFLLEAVSNDSQMIRNGADDTIYVLPGSVSTGFYSYSISSNTWTALATVPANVSIGSQMIRNGSDNEIYVLVGNNSNGFYKYLISSNTWTTLTVVPTTIYTGSQMIRNGASDTIYVLRGGLYNFYSYSISGNTWTTLNDIPGNVLGGAQMIRNGSDNEIYVLRGTTQASFYSYSISGNTWTTLAVVPGGVNYGAQMIRNGADDTIYVLQGNNVTGFYSYSISSNTWTTLSDAPGNIYYGSQMIRN
ncbi:MAG: hypothetical protein Q8P20_06090, partial [bacterium]|nr:hypothetical protein [bacterium]